MTFFLFQEVQIVQDSGNSDSVMFNSSKDITTTKVNGQYQIPQSYVILRFCNIGYFWQIQLWFTSIDYQIAEKFILPGAMSDYVLFW